jgi:hypothetical protein
MYKATAEISIQNEVVSHGLLACLLHNEYEINPVKLYLLQGIVSRDFMVCFLVSFNRSEVSAHKKRVYLLLQFHFCVEFF